MNALNPICSRRLQSRIAVHMAPLWLISATVPGRAMVCAKVAFSPVTGHITPKQFGPMMRIRVGRAAERTCRSSSNPRWPASRNPAEIITAPLTPACAHSSIIPGTVSAGVMITASSGASGKLATFGYARIPSTLLFFAFTG